ncbi:transposase [Secundilactobacillus pentosiphilus]|uniref:Transposase n=1 Tax=Secundilactobacillus pentosiphilus TaxID=1714682 RepID=A0A1Z5IZ77_9LACO|nr:IS66 family insertion sequence element accessory protein TnpB [Secundilactobacillus pentosiphilus]GAX06936.1 transposase [Secundilactobacillus pentosiphilus]
MLIDLRQLKGIYLICGKTDLRRGIDGLAATITDQYELDPYSRALFLFCGTRKDRFKALYWAGDGFLGECNQRYWLLLRKEAQGFF